MGVAGVAWERAQQAGRWLLGAALWLVLRSARAAWRLSQKDGSKMGSAIILGALLAFFTSFTPRSLPEVECGSLNQRAFVAKTFSSPATYDISTTIAENGDPLGLYSSTYGADGIPLLDANRPGSLSKVDHLELATPDEYLRAVPNVTMEQVSRVQNFLAQRNVGADRDHSRTYSLQVAIWAALGQFDPQTQLSPSLDRVEEWRSFIENQRAEIEATSQARHFSTAAMDASLGTSQYNGWIRVDFGVVDGTENRRAGEHVFVSTVGSSGASETDEKGEATIWVPNPGPGYAQTVVAEWRGTIPAGTILRAVYEEGESPQDPAFLVTAAPVGSSATMTLHLPTGACQ